MHSRSRIEQQILDIIAFICVAEWAYLKTENAISNSVALHSTYTYKRKFTHITQISKVKILTVLLQLATGTCVVFC